MADFYINPEGSSGKKVFIGAYNSRENSILTIDNATGNSYFMNGRVCIGTTTPSDGAHLTIADGTIPTFVLTNSTTNSRLILYVNPSYGANGIVQTGDIIYKVNGPVHHLVFHLSDNNNDGNSYIQFSDDANGLGTKYLITGQ